MKAMVSILIEASIYSCVVALAIMAFRAALKKKLSPRLQYGLWLLLILRLVIPVSIESGFHLDILPAVQSAPHISLTEPEPGAQGAAFALADEAAAPVLEASAPAPGGGAQQAAAQPQAAANNPPEPMDLSAIAFSVWLAGAAGLAAWFNFVKYRYFSRMCAVAVKPPEETARTFAQCKAELKLTGDVRLLVTKANISPGITLFLKPTVLMPASLTSDPCKLRFALLHELSHYKRGDHIMYVITNVLRCVYWFNPVVHFAFSLIQQDMETACDARVLLHIGAEQKRGYLATVIALFSYEALPQLGMARLTARSMAKKRIEGAFMKHKAALPVRLAAGLLSAVLLVACFTTACQRTGAPLAASISADALNAQATPSTTSTPLAATPAPAAAPIAAVSLAAQALRASCTITYRPDEPEQYEAAKENMKRIAASLNNGGGTVIAPDEQWSFLESFEPITVENGYASGELTAGVSCVSTAIYCTLLMSGLEVTERHAHAWTPAWAEKGLDASVNTGGNDLKFKNTASSPVRLTIEIDESNEAELKVTAYIYGEAHPSGITYSLISRVTKTMPQGDAQYVSDDALPSGTEQTVVAGRDGCTVEIIRETLENGVSTAGELLYTDVYKSVNAIIHVGTN